ncbi:DUF4918 family protein [Panacibacter ginsenosidivorans]|uniref:DUF4918 family protein n=1 Tax=Panacibacter ginsenosidivorans TaxID=1813871 RepID=A0A5B8VA98_9BACT|nr:uracil-DNA glycosylase family protein [Panacibacter ginsenosidivorans]QEC68397.1 DUF4918 family protein [Panacibacter ginsenosidivorans]
MKTFAENILDFLFDLELPFKLPNKIEVLDAHKLPEVHAACKIFYEKFYTDHNERYLLIGINPGRFGGGVTGIPFTDPVRLQNDCGIENNFQKKQELSSVFIYDMINAYGGTQKFYSKFYISAVSPLGFVRAGKNLNYYDDKVLQQRIEPFVIDCMEKQIVFGIKRNICFCIGEGENFKYLKKLNEKHAWFDEIKALSHPRFVMQYKLKTKDLYIQQYIHAFARVTQA